MELDTVMTAKAQLPEIGRSDPKLWFAQLDHYFMGHKIKSGGTRYEELCPLFFSRQRPPRLHFGSAITTAIHHLETRDNGPFVTVRPSENPKVSPGRNIR